MTDKTPALPYQARVHEWLLACFGAEITGDRIERNHRFIEEALELVQSCGCTASEAHQLVDYVFGRPVGEPAQEVGGVMNTLAALCIANGMDMADAGEVELARVWTKVEKIRAKQAAKPKHSPLPEAPRAPVLPADVAGLVDRLTDLQGVIDDSEGVAGWHMNGEVLAWEGFDVEAPSAPGEAAAALTAQAAQIAALEGERDRLREALADDRTFLSVLHGDVAQTEKTDPRWEGMTAVVLRQKAKVDAALAEPDSDAGEGK